MTASSSGWKGQVTDGILFILPHIKNLTLALTAAVVVSPTGAAVTISTFLGMVCLLSLIQIWADIEEFEPVTIHLYRMLIRLTGKDPRQLNVVIETGILPLVTALNSLPGVETMFSCQGHPKCAFSRLGGLLPRFWHTGPYVMFRTENDSLCLDLTERMYSQTFNDCWTYSLKNYWTLKAQFRPSLSDSTGEKVGGDFVWVLRCEIVNGLFWQKRHLIDEDIDTISGWIAKISTTD